MTPRATGLARFSGRSFGLAVRVERASGSVRRGGGAELGQGGGEPLQLHRDRAGATAARRGAPADRHPRADRTAASGPRSGWAATSAARSPSPSSDRRTTVPTTAWASRNGIPRSTSHSARSVAASSGASAAACIRSVHERRRGDHPRHGAEGQADLVDGVEQRLLVLLQVAVVGERQALQHGQQPGQVADQRGRPCPGPARRCRGSSSAASSTSRWRSASSRRAKPNSSLVHSTNSSPMRDRWMADAGSGRTAPRPRSRGRRRRRGELSKTPAKPRSAAGDARDRAAATSRPARRRRAARRRGGDGRRGAGRRRGPSAQPWASRWWASSTGWARCRCV